MPDLISAILRLDIGLILNIISIYPEFMVRIIPSKAEATPIHTLLNMSSVEILVISAWRRGPLNIEIRFQTE